MHVAWLMVMFDLFKVRLFFRSAVVNGGVALTRSMSGQSVIVWH